MTRVSRKYSKAKWDMSAELAVNSVSADAITTDLKTTGNTLSLWVCTNESELESVVVALASGSDRLDKLDIAWMDLAQLEDQGLVVKATQGATPVVDFRDRHRDVVDLNYGGLGKFAGLFVSALRKDQCRRFTRADVVALLKKALEARRLDLRDLKEGVREVIARHLGETA